MCRFVVVEVDRGENTGVAMEVGDRRRRLSVVEVYRGGRAGIAMRLEIY